MGIPRVLTVLLTLGKHLGFLSDLLRVKQTMFPNSLNIHTIFLQEVAIRLTQVAPIYWGLVFALFRVG